MNITKILEYQKTDSELFKIEKALRENSNKKTMQVMTQNAKNAQTRTTELESRAEALLKEIDTVKKQFAAQESKINEITSKDIDKLSKQEIDAWLSLKDKLAQNLNILDRNLTKLAENVNATLAEFNKAAKAFNASRDKMNESKAAYERDVAAVEPERKRLEGELKNLENGIDAALLEKYKKRRADNLFPVLVPLSGNTCGGCRMELPAAEISKLKQDGLLTCEHCRRLIYFN